MRSGLLHEDRDRPGYGPVCWWVNPARAVKQRLGQVAAVLSVPDEESEMARIGRLAQLRRYLADDVHIRAGAEEIRTRDAALAALAAWKPQPGGGDVHFADVQVFIESDTAAHAYLAVELPGVDRDSAIRSASGASGFPRACTLRIAARPG